MSDARANTIKPQKMRKATTIERKRPKLIKPAENASVLRWTG